MLSFTFWSNIFSPFSDRKNQQESLEGKEIFWFWFRGGFSCKNSRVMLDKMSFSARDFVPKHHVLLEGQESWEGLMVSSQPPSKWNTNSSNGFSLNRKAKFVVLLGENSNVIRSNYQRIHAAGWSPTLTTGFSQLLPMMIIPMMMATIDSEAPLTPWKIFH